MCRIRSTQPNTRRRGAVLAAALRLAAVSAAPAFAGPPFQTDDPEPIEYKHWENNLFTLETVTRGNAMGTGPGLDINYGLLPNVQLNPILPLEYQSGPGRPISFGNGNAEIGVKYRFYKPAEGDLSPQMAFYPFLEVPTGNKSLGFSTGHFQLFIPLWLQRELGPWTVYGGGGYWINPGAENRNFWFTGIVAQRDITDRLSFGLELFHQTSSDRETPASTGFNLGGAYRLTEHLRILASAGRGLQNISATNQFSYYLGLQFAY